jgi:hypothetical protein
MLTHVHKVKHLVVGTFEPGWWSLRSRGGHCADWTQDKMLDLRVRSVVEHWLRFGLATKCWWDREIRHVGPASGPCWRTLMWATKRAWWRPDIGMCSIVGKRTCPVAFGRLWNLSRVNLMRGGVASGEVIGASGHKTVGPSIRESSVHPYLRQDHAQIRTNHRDEPQIYNKRFRDLLISKIRSTTVAQGA